MSKGYFGKLATVALILGSFSVAQAQTTIYDTVKAVLDYNPSLKSIQENKVALEYNLQQARAGWFPKLDASAQGTLSEKQTQKHPWVNGDNYDTGFSASLQLSQTLWDGLATLNSVRASEFRLESIDHRVFDTSTSLALEGIIAHTDVLTRQTVVGLTRTYVKMHREILNKQSSLSRSGVGTTADYTQAMGRLLRSEATLSESIAAFDNAHTIYAQLTGKAAPADLVVATAPSPAYSAVDAAVDAALNSNPKVNAYKSDVKTAQSERDKLAAAFHPQVSLVGAAGYTDPASGSHKKTYMTASGPQTKQEYNDNQVDLSAGIQATWNLFNGGADRAAYKAQSASMRQTRQDLHSVADSVIQDVKTTWTNYNTYLELEKSYASALEYNIRTRDAYMRQYTMGMRSLLDVLDAESELYSSSVNLTNARANKVIAAYKLLALEGQLLPELQLETPPLPLEDITNNW